MRRDEMLELYSDYLLTTCGYATATGLSAITDGDIGHDSVTNFLSSNEFTSKDLWGLVKKDVKSIACDGGVLIVDDTIEEKPHTDENDIICWHWDHSKNCNVKGVNLLNLLVNYDGKSLPIAYEIVHKTEKYIDKDGKNKRRSKITKNEMFRSLFDISIKNNVKFQYVAWDIWFSSKENMQHVKSKGKDFISAIKDNRLVAISRDDKLAGKFVNLSSLKLDENSTKELYIQGLDFPVLACKQVFINADGSQGILHLVTSDLNLNFSQPTENKVISNGACFDLKAPKFHQIYQKRWEIEVYHKSLKQNAALAKSPTKTVKTQSNHIFMSIYAFCKLQMIALKNATSTFGIRTNMLIKANKTMMQELINIKANGINLSTA